MVWMDTPVIWTWSSLYVSRRCLISEGVKMLQDPDRMTGFTPDIDLSLLPRTPLRLHRIVDAFTFDM